MKREIKFRAWDKVQKVMMVPRDVQTDSDGNIFYVEAMGPDGEYDEGDLDVFELEQFTGLKDVNGKEIYENDILKVTSDDGSFYLATVKWFGDSGYPAFDLEGIPSFCNYDANALATIFGSSLETCEVIGNIFENPELLEAEK